jgi:hypothetical protein
MLGKLPDLSAAVSVAHKTTTGNLTISANSIGNTLNSPIILTAAAWGPMESSPIIAKPTGRCFAVDQANFLPNSHPVFAKHRGCSLTARHLGA